MRMDARAAVGGSSNQSTLRPDTGASRSYAHPLAHRVVAHPRTDADRAPPRALDLGAHSLSRRPLVRRARRPRERARVIDGRTRPRAMHARPRADDAPASIGSSVLRCPQCVRSVARAVWARSSLRCAVRFVCPQTLGRASRLAPRHADALSCDADPSSPLYEPSRARARVHGRQSSEPAWSRRMSQSSSQRRSSRDCRPRGEPEVPSDPPHRARHDAMLAQVAWHERSSHATGRIRTAANWGARIRTEIAGTKTQSPAIGRPPKGRLAEARGRYYDASVSAAHRRHSCRRPGDAHAVRAAEGPAPAVRASAGPLAHRRSARGRGRDLVVVDGRNGARRASARGREIVVQQKPTGPAARCRRGRAIDRTRRWWSCRRRAAHHAEAIGARRGPRERGAAGDDGDDGARRPRPTAASSATRRRVENGRRGEGRRATRRPSSSRSARSTPASTRSTAARCRRARPIDRQRAGRALPPRRAAQAAEAGKTVAAHLVTDPTLTLGVNDRVELAEVRALAQQRIHDAHARNGVTIVDPARRGSTSASRSARTRSIEPGTILKGAHDDRRGLRVGPLHDDHRLARSATASRPALLPRPGAGRRLRDDRAVRLPAPRRPPARERQGRHVRRDQELRHRRGHEGPAPLLHRRRRHRREHEHRRRQHHRQLRRQQEAPHEDRREGQDQRGHGVRRAGRGRGRRVHGSG